VYQTSVFFSGLAGNLSYAIMAASLALALLAPISLLSAIFARCSSQSFSKNLGDFLSSLLAVHSLSKYKEDDLHPSSNVRTKRATVSDKILGPLRPLSQKKMLAQGFLEFLNLHTHFRKHVYDYVLSFEAWHLY
jgi:hypothetical protein